MTTLDVAILVIVGISFLIGIVRGLVKEALSLVTWGLALWLGFSFANSFSRYFERFFNDEYLQLIASFLMVLVITLIAFSLVGYILASLFDSTGLSGIDRSLGGVFGLLRGAVIIAALILLAGSTGLPNESWWQDAVLVDYFKPLAKFIYGLIPNNLSEYLNKA